MSNKYKRGLKDYPRITVVIVILIALILSVVCFWLVFNLKIEAVILPDDVEKAEGYGEGDVIWLQIPSADISLFVTMADGSQKSVDKYDVIQDKRCPNIRLLGHADKVFSKLPDTKLNDIISYDDVDYKVIFSGQGVEGQDKTNIVSSDTNDLLLGKADMELVTCIDDGDLNRWVVLADKIERR